MTDSFVDTILFEETQMAKVDPRVLAGPPAAGTESEERKGPSLSEDVKASRVSREQAREMLSRGGATVARVRQPRVARRVVWALALVAIGGSIWHIEDANSSFHHQYQANQVRMDQLDADLKKAEASSQVPDTAPSTQKQWIAQAQAAGVQVAKDENSYAQQGGNATSIASDIGRYLDAADQGERVPWYSTTDASGTSSDSAPWSWTFAAPTSFHGNTADVSWVCREASDGRILAYTTGTYNAQTHLFGSMKRSTTTLGQSLMPKTNDDEDGTHK